MGDISPARQAMTVDALGVDAVVLKPNSVFRRPAQIR
jgi:hypothetical protein